MGETNVDSQRKIVAIAIIIIAIIVIAVIALVATGGNKDNVTGGNSTSQSTNATTKEEAYENNKSDIDMAGTENVTVNDDMTTTNTSAKIKEDKTVSGLVISGITVKYTGSGTQISGTITNSTGSEINADFVKVNVIDKNGNTFRTIDTYIGKVKANGSKSLDITTQADVSNMYDIEFTK